MNCPHRLAATLVFGFLGCASPEDARPAPIDPPVPEGPFAGSPVVADAARVELLSEEFIFTEGPAADAAGNVYFTDQPNDRILVWSTAGELSTFLTPCGRSNGLRFDQGGALLACADEWNELWSIDVDAKVGRVLVKDFEGKLLNGPNDLWVDPDGGIWFTDPYYRRDYWTRGDPEQDGRHVYYVAPDRTSVRRAATGFVQPNGIIGTPDGERLYVADIGDDKTYEFRIRPGGVLAERRLVVDLGSDGMTLDARGNLYLTGSGVTVVDPRTGVTIEHIPVDESWTANATFGGADRKRLFITAMDSLYAVDMKVRGAQ